MPKKILLADDSVTIQKVVELTFVEEDYEVSCVSNGRAAVDKIKEDRPDILLCDVIMPEMNGYEVASFVKGDPAYSSIPVILLTGTFEPFDEDKARATGAETYITKPFDSKMLVDKVEELLSRRIVYKAPEHAETAEVFHSRQEFVVTSEEQAGPTAEEAAASEESGAFMSPELEYEMPGEALEPTPQASVEETVISADRAAEPRDLEVSSSLPSEPEESGIDEPDAGELVLESADVEEVDVPGAGLEDETTADMGTQQTGGDGLSEAVDVGEIMPEDEIPETAFGELVTPAETGEEHEASYEASAPASIERTGEGEDVPGGTESGAPPDEVEDLGAFEPTAFEEPLEEAEAPEPPPIVHELTEQQEMVSEAQKVLDAQAEAEGSDEVVDAPPEPEESGELAGEAQAEESFGGLEPEVAPESESPAQVTEEPIAADDTAGAILEESPFMSDAVGEEALEGEAEAGEEQLKDSSAEEMAGPQTAEETGFPSEGEEAYEEQAAFAAVGMAAEGEEQVTEETDQAEPVETESAEGPAGQKVNEAGEPAAVVTEPEPVAVGEQPESVPAQVDGSKVEEMVRDAVEQLLPAAVERAVGEAVETAVRKAADEIVAAKVREAIGDALPDMVKEQAGLLVPEIGREAVARMLPDMIRQEAGETVSGTVKPMAEAEAASAVSRAIGEALPEAIRQAAMDTTPAVVGQVAEERAPEVIRETVKAISRDIVAEEVKASLPDIVRPLAWEVIPELAESIIKRRIQELETEETD